MEFLFEVIFEIFFEVGEEICSNKKINKWVRYPVLIIFALFYSIVILGLIFLGIYFIKTNILAGLIFIITGITLLLGIIFKFKKFYKEKVSNNSQD